MNFYRYNLLIYSINGNFSNKSLNKSQNGLCYASNGVQRGMERIEKVNRYDQFKNAAQMIISASGDDPQREGLLATPDRVARSYEYLLRGYEQKLEDVVHGAIFKAESDDMVIVRDIEFYSLCEHHGRYAPRNLRR